MIDLVIFSTVLYLSMARQNTYHIVHDSVVIESYNHSLIREPYINVEDFNATNNQATIRGHAHIGGVKENILVTAVAFKLVGQLYRTFPFDISFDICDEMKHDRTNMVFQHSNLPGCPFQPGYYYINDYVLEEEKFPPHIPYGKYKLFVKIYIDETIFVANGTWMGAIVKKN